jgi:hypothetical protein
MPTRHDDSYNTALVSNARFRYDISSLITLNPYRYEYPPANPALTNGHSRMSEEPMPKYIIEREIPGIGMFTSEQLQQASQKSCSVLQKLGPKIQWVQSHVTDDKMYCVYIAPDEATVHEHARLGGFPANRVARVKAIIDPTTAEI